MKVLSPDQVAAFDALVESIRGCRLESVLTGYAGTGKTTLMQEVVQEFDGERDVVLVAPTGKAAKVLQAKTGRATKTIHSAIYGSVHEGKGKLNFGRPKPPCERGGLVLCDEASMVGGTLARDLRREVSRVGGQLLALGDKGQLPPVNDTWGFDLDSPTAELSTVHRQALGSPIIRAATWVREGKDPKDFDAWGEPGLLSYRTRTLDPADWLASALNNGDDATLLCFSNKKRVLLNNKVRALLGRRYTLECGDQILCLLNNSETGMVNGETAKVVEVYSDAKSTGRFGVDFGYIRLDNGVEARFCPGLLGKDTKDFSILKKRLQRKHKVELGDLLHIDYGYCMTVHKSQGSQYDRVGFIDDGALRWLRREDPETWQRLVYTAYTRAASELNTFVGR